MRCPTFFPAFLVLGFGIIIVLQAFVNMSVAVFPGVVTGQPLPLISKGGTSILITSFYIGVILSVSRYVKKKEQKAPLVEAVPDGETSEYYTDGAMS
jgi:cell division protein FtsW